VVRAGESAGTFRLLAYPITTRCLLLTNNAAPSLFVCSDLLLLRVLLLLLGAAGDYLGRAARLPPGAKTRLPSAAQYPLANCAEFRWVWVHRDKQTGRVAEDESVPSVMMITSAQRVGRYGRKCR
jgi:hypothetical protein